MRAFLIVFACGILNSFVTAADVKYDKLKNYTVTQVPAPNLQIKATTYLQAYSLWVSSYRQNTAFDIKFDVRLTWQDQRLTWKPEEYSNQTFFMAKSNEIWAPVLKDYLYIEEFNDVKIGYYVYCEISNSGNVSCLTKWEMNTNCDSNYKNWPFDVQYCNLTIGSYKTDPNGIFIEVDSKLQLGLDFNGKPMRNTHWGSSKFKGLVFKHKRFDFTVYEIAFARHSSNHWLVVITPAIILVLFNVISSCLRVNSTPRIILLFLNAFFHFQSLSYLNFMVPPNGNDVPSIMVLFSDSFIITAECIIITIVVHSLYLRRTKAPIIIEMLSDVIVSNRFGDFLCGSNYIIDDRNNDEDEENLVEASKPDYKDRMIWKQFAIIVDRLNFFCILMTYFIMFIMLIPKEKFQF